MAVPPDAGSKAAFQTLFRDEHQVFVVELETLREASPSGKAKKGLLHIVLDESAESPLRIRHIIEQ